MAFLDNSGDIILDAVLTDLGRKRLAQGNFKISKLHKKSILLIGNFDGLHLGHHKLFS